MHRQRIGLAPNFRNSVESRESSVARPLRLTITGLVGVRASSSRMKLAFSIVIRRIIAPVRVLTNNHASPQARDRADAPWRLAVLKMISDALC